MPRWFWAGALCAGAAAFAACGMPDWAGETVVDPDAAAEPACKPPQKYDVDLSKQKECCDDHRAHCISKSKLHDPTKAPNYAPCDGDEVCLPNSILNGEKPKACKSIAGPGACRSTCIATVAAQPALQQGECAEGERCAPCRKPDGTWTGACDGMCDASDAGAADACGFTGTPLSVDGFPVCTEGTHCIPNATIAQGGMSQKQLDELDTCDGGRCVPDSIYQTAGKEPPKECTTVEGQEGRCLHESLKDVKARGDKLHQSTCATYERCLPCFNPLDGQPTPACSIGCDHPKQPASVYPTCCGGKGRCVPPTQVSEQQKSLLGNCSDDGAFCAPLEMAQPGFTPQPCTAFGAIAGVCLSTCLPVVKLVKGVDTSACDGDHACVPCSIPGIDVPGCS